MPRGTTLRVRRIVRGPARSHPYEMDGGVTPSKNARGEVRHD